VMLDDVIGQQGDHIKLHPSPRGRQLEGTEAHQAGGGAAHHGPRLILDIAAAREGSLRPWKRVQEILQGKGPHHGPRLILDVAAARPRRQATFVLAMYLCMRKEKDAGI